ncbi:MAG: hypothetical protein RJA09_1776, partial [Pseudomonadota bacterium]
MPLSQPPHALDLRHLARDGVLLEGLTPVTAFARLSAGGGEGGGGIRWTARAELRSVVGGADQLWLHLCAEGHAPQVCQRCLSPFWQPVALERWFRFVSDEATAEAEDEDSEEDVLAFVPRFDLGALLEDELLLALPLVPMHEPDCP